MVLQKSDGTESDKNKMHVDGDETKTPEKQLPLNLKFVTTPIEQVSKHRLLGVTVDEQLKLQTHINNMCRTVSRNIFLLSKLSQIVSQKSKLAFFFAHIMSHMNYVSNAWGGCAGVHMKQLYSLHKRAVKFLIPIPNLDYKQKCCALKLLPLDKQLLPNKCVLMQKVVHGKAPQYLKDLMIPSERLHGNKQLLPRTRIESLKRSFSFSGSLAWNSFFFFFFFFSLPSTSLWGFYSETFIHRYSISLAHAFTRPCMIFAPHMYILHYNYYNYN